MPSTYFPLTLRLYAYVLRCLSNHNYTGLDLFYHVKDCWKHRDTPHDLLVKPLERGLSFKIGEWCFNQMFDADGWLAWETRPFFKQLEREDFLWFLEDVVEASHRSEFFGKSDILEAMKTCIDDIGNLYDANEATYWEDVKAGGRRKALKIFSTFCRTHKSPLSQMRKLYANDVADRILHLINPLIF
jgi:hypothetical protein